VKLTRRARQQTLMIVDPVVKLPLVERSSHRHPRFSATSYKLAWKIATHWYNMLNSRGK
jgi:hypothetical protein